MHYAHGADNPPGTPAQLGECEGYDINIHAALWNLQVVAGGFFKIRVGQPGVDRCLSVAAGTNTVVLQPCGAGLELQWSNEAVAAGNLLQYKIKNRGTQKYLMPSFTPGQLYVDVEPAFEQHHWLFYR